MAVHSKSAASGSAAAAAASTTRSSRRAAVVADLARSSSSSTPSIAAAAAAELMATAPGGSPGRPPTAVPRKRARLDTLVNLSAPKGPVSKKQKVTAAYPIRSRPVAADADTRAAPVAAPTPAVARAHTAAVGEAPAARPPSPPGPRRGRGRQQGAAAEPAGGARARKGAVKKAPSRQADAAVQTPAGERVASASRVGGRASDASAAPPPPAAGINGTHAAAAGLQAARAIDKRALRSQDGGSRSRSELSLYFPNYEGLISNEPKETELLTADTRVFITDDPAPKSPKTVGKTLLLHSPARLPPSKLVPSPRKKPGKGGAPLKTAAAAAAPAGADALNHFQTLDFANTLAKLPRSTVDPLTPDVFAVAHRRAERQEKQLRNIEKERAQHEKVQLERLFDGLRGPDWLRVMGISGVTEGERKAWEGKRAYFVKEVGGLLEKFRVWKEEEKRRKHEKELADRMVSEEEDEDEDVEDSDDEDEAANDEGEDEGDDDDDEEDEDEDNEAATDAIEADADDDEGAEDEDSDEDENDDDDDDDDDRAAGTSDDASAAASSTRDTPDPAGDADMEIPDSDAVSSPAPAAAPAGGRGKGKQRGGTRRAAAAPRKKRSPAQLDVDALAAQQLHTEALLSAKRPGSGPWEGAVPSSSSRSSSATSKQPLATPATPAPGPPLTSFFRKAHQRTTALAPGRRSSGRVQMAFGQPIPEIDEGDFALPTHLATADARRASARSRRARRRGD